MQINSLASVVAPQDTTSTSSTSSTSSSSNAANSNSLADPNLFITLLTAQLQAQDPTNPMSPEDMVNQLTEVSSLQQLISINQTLTNLAAAAVPASTPASGSNGINA